MGDFATKMAKRRKAWWKGLQRAAGTETERKVKSGRIGMLSEETRAEIQVRSDEWRNRVNQSAARRATPLGAPGSSVIIELNQRVMIN